LSYVIFRISARDGSGGDSIPDQRAEGMEGGFVPDSPVTRLAALDQTGVMGMNNNAKNTLDIGDGVGKVSALYEM
jgi:hypothetical protein